MGKPQLKIGNRIISQSTPPYIIAEAGVHHYNSVELAKRYFMEAKIAGADAVKFQTYTAKRIVTKWAPTYWDAPNGRTQYDVFAERSLFNKNDYKKLFDYARDLGITFLSTPFDPDSAAMLAELGMPVFKVASADITYFPLLETIAQFNKPILLSTGASTYKEIKNTVGFLRSLKSDFALLHCVLSYPTLLQDANLQRIVELSRRFADVMIGYSDHTQPQDSMLACPLAVGLGAQIIEKHFTLNKHLDEDDHYHAVDSRGLAQLVRDCKDAAMMTTLGEEMKESEIPARTNARRSIVAAHFLNADTVLTMDDIDFKRPGIGLSPMLVNKVLGKVLITELQEDELIKFSNLILPPKNQTTG